SYTRVSSRYNVYENNGQYYFVTEEGGIASQIVIYNLSKDDYQLLEEEKRSASEIHFKLQNDRWPPTKEEKHQSELEFLKNELQLVHDVSLPNNPNLFDEFPELKPIYEQWLSNK
ncbi:hypothetical protein OGZ37_13150, partial [Lactococcus lactis]|uniref:hypothetical protein n=1 Tax=Lactococcus lactis TaxID=1358 RepID=UPI002418893C